MGRRKGSHTITVLGFAPIGNAARGVPLGNGENMGFCLIMTLLEQGAQGRYQDVPNKHGCLVGAESGKKAVCTSYSTEILGSFVDNMTVA